MAEDNKTENQPADETAEKKKPEGKPKGEKRAKGGKGGKGDGDAKIAAGRQVKPKGYVPRMRQRYDAEVKAVLKEKFKYNNDLEVPRLDKIVLNMGVGEAVGDAKKVQAAARDLSLIAGQKAVIAKSRKSIAAFKLREGMSVGCKVTLRDVRMYEFLDRLVTIALPRVRDFRGLSGKSFDGNGNYAMGLKEHIVFPEIDYDKVESILGMDIVFCTTAKTNEEAKELLRHFDLPFAQ